MARYIPPASVIYFPNAPILWSSPVPTFIPQANTRIHSAYEAIGSMWFYFGGTRDIIEYLVQSFGNYRLTFEAFTTALPATIQILQDGTPIATISLTGSPHTYDIMLRNIKQGSFIRVRGITQSNLITAYIRNLTLWGNPLSLARVNWGPANLSTDNPTGQTGPTTTLETTLPTPPPPPTRDVRNTPVRRGKIFAY